MLIYNDPSGEAYRKLIDDMAARTATFSLKGPRIPKFPEPDEPPIPEWPLLEEIRPYFVEERVQYCEVGHDDEHGVYRDYSYDDIYWHYRCCPETAEFLKKTTNHLFGWNHPALPEDLCFWSADRMYVMGGTSHEDIATIHATSEEVERLYHEIPGVFIIEYSAFRDPLHMLELTRYHRHDRLELMGPGAAEALNRVDEIPWLRVLEVHDETLEELPESLFRVEKLRHLTLCTRNLHSIPANIARLQNLRFLEITNVPLLSEGCVYSYKSTAGPKEWKLLPKQQLTLTSLPPEIGLLKRLRSLTINYTGLRELPESFAELRHLRYLDLSDNLLENENPAILKKLPKLKSAYTARDSGAYSGPHSRGYFE